jgi:hypothetical protein
MRIVGIDLAGSEKRDTGYCFLSGKQADVVILHSDEEILASILSERPDIVAIDAPLSLPKGRKSIEKRDKHHFRQCDLELRRLGIRFFPITLGPMRMLTKRGMALKKKIMDSLPGIRVIEVYPGATYDLLGAQRKNRISIMRLFRKNGIRTKRKGLTQDELDGICCALTAQMFMKNKAIGIGDQREGIIIVPGSSGQI